MLSLHPKCHESLPVSSSPRQIETISLLKLHALRGGWGLNVGQPSGGRLGQLYDKSSEAFDTRVYSAGNELKALLNLEDKYAVGRFLHLALEKRASML